MEKILVSACLHGEKLRYDGGDKEVDHIIWQRWQTEGRIVSICPEVSGGLSVPRLPAEIIDAHTVINTAQEDVTDAFLAGAENALKRAQEHNIRLAVLTENSPSCGSQFIYDGSFNGKKIVGEGLTTRLLRRHGIQVFSERQLQDAQAYLEKLL